MKIFRLFLTILWRIWFYILMGVPILIMFPLLFIATLREKWYPLFFRLAQVWAMIIIYGMGFMPKVKREIKLSKRKSYMFVANHTSMTDIMLMLITVNNPFVFVGKVELAKIPIFGFFYRRTCILVDRGDQKSRQEVFERAQKRLNAGVSICIFPEGGVPADKNLILDSFKDGAFRLAISHQIPIVPITFFDNKKRFSYQFLTGSPGRMRANIHPCISTKAKVLTDKKEVREKARAVILAALKNSQF